MEGKERHMSFDTETEYVTVVLRTSGCSGASILDQIASIVPVQPVRDDMDTDKDSCKYDSDDDDVGSGPSSERSLDTHIVNRHLLNVYLGSDSSATRRIILEQLVKRAQNYVLHTGITAVEDVPSAVLLVNSKHSVKDGSGSASGSGSGSFLTIPHTSIIVDTCFSSFSEDQLTCLSAAMARRVMQDGLSANTHDSIFHSMATVARMLEVASHRPSILEAVADLLPEFCIRYKRDPYGASLVMHLLALATSLPTGPLGHVLMLPTKVMDELEKCLDFARDVVKDLLTAARALSGTPSESGPPLGPSSFLAPAECLGALAALLFFFNCGLILSPRVVFEKAGPFLALVSQSPLLLEETHLCTAALLAQVTSTYVLPDAMTDTDRLALVSRSLAAVNAVLEHKLNQRKPMEVADVRLLSVAVHLLRRLVQSNFVVVGDSSGAEPPGFLDALVKVQEIVKVFSTVPDIHVVWGPLKALVAACLLAMKEGNLNLCSHRCSVSALYQWFGGPGSIGFASYGVLVWHATDRIDALRRLVPDDISNPMTLDDVIHSTLDDLTTRECTCS